LVLTFGFCGPIVVIRNPARTGPKHLVHLVRYLWAARPTASVSLDKQGLPSGLDRTRGVVEHSELQSKRSNPNARRQLGDLMEDAPSPPNLGAFGAFGAVTATLTNPRRHL
jgi:hypothetical protein